MRSLSSGRGRAALASVCMMSLLLTSSVHAAVLEEVIVTAQKREQLLSDVPISISVIQGATVEDFSIQDFEELQAYVPNLFINDTPANNSVFIRGIGTEGNVLAFETSVALFVDGIYAGRNRAFHNPYLDMQRVEVLRGPQGALFGRNTAAGAISIITGRPTEEFSGWVQGDYEFEYDSYQVSGAVSGSLSENFQARLAARVSDTAGYLYNTTLDRDEPDSEDWQMRVSATWQPSDRVDGYFKIEASENDIVGMPFELVLNGGEPDYLKNSDDAFDPIKDFSETFNALAQFDFQIGEHVLTSITGYSSFDYENSFDIEAAGPSHLVTFGAEDFSQVSQELRLLSPTGGTLEYIVGAYFSNEESDIFRRSTTDLPFTPARPESITQRWYDQETDVISLFGQATWNINERWRLTGGLRWTDTGKDAHLERNFIGFAPGALRTPIDASQDDSDWDPSVNLTFDLTDEVMLYAAYAQGSKGGGFNGASSNLTAANYEYAPEKSENYELGMKYHSAVTYLNVVLFNTEYEDLQKSALDLNLGAGGGFVTSNAAEARSKGVELEAGWAATDWLDLTGSLAYLNAEYISYPGAKCPVGFPGFNLPNCATDIAGYPLTNAPDWTGSLIANINQPLSEKLTLIGGLTATYQDDILFQPSYNPLEVQESYWLLNARIGLAGADSRWSAVFLVKNLADENYSSLIYETFPLWLPNPARDRVHLPGRPRTYTLQLRYNF